ncbi:hypothetical protein MC7420_3701 [Coleofasciculus chthonoplastes PCC 7420]|uniref:Uncharacterized protein n=1 Tax=Coleofasciculus chthonoplastes PCC 7420 TaxID=118168 RepID=B4VX61_9CYAN|nr:hypothetical protein MC7420_3701 [Coleofasciculus chthonoplastes PCC 7420]
MHSSQKNSLETPVIVFDLAAEESSAKSNRFPCTKVGKTPTALLTNDV